ncbi:MAG: hypothetical protein ACLFRV_11220 [Acidimicrobiales bacterium]
MSILSLHGDFAWVVVFANAAAGVWALGAHYYEPLRHRALWWFTAAAQVTIFVQAILGTIMIASQSREVDDFHTFYGFASLAAVGIIYSYRQQVHQWRYLLYGLGGLFLMGMAIRTMTIGM